MRVKSAVFKFNMLIGMLSLGCEASYPDIPEMIVQSTQCRSIETFGDGRTCDGLEAGDVSGLEEACGDGGACSSHGVCVQDPLFLGCSCLQDEDCAGWTGYLNGALSLEGEEIIPPVCYGGGCVFAAEQMMAEDGKDEDSSTEVDAE